MTCRAEKHQLATANALDNENRNKTGEEVFGPVTGSDDARLDVVDAEALEKQGLKHNLNVSYRMTSHMLNTDSIAKGAEAISQQITSL